MAAAALSPARRQHNHRFAESMSHSGSTGPVQPLEFRSRPSAPAALPGIRERTFFPLPTKSTAPVCHSRLGTCKESAIRPLLMALAASAACAAVTSHAAQTPGTADQNGGNTQTKDGASQSATAAPAAPPAPVIGNLYIREYRVLGAHHVPGVDVERTVYPYLGPGRTTADVEQARAALEQAYHDKGYQAATVQIPRQQGRNGIIYLNVLEGTVAKLRVHGARYFLPDQIKAGAPSLAEGKVVDFNSVTRDIVALNQLPDRRVTPSLTAGEEPGTVNIDLTVKDTFPLHGSLELNNRYSAGTSPLRLNGSASYNNLWQLGHSIGGSFQVAPQNVSEVNVYSAFYIARFAEPNWLSLMLTGTKQDSNVSTLSAVAVAGKGETVGLRAMVNLPSLPDFYQSLSFGIDYKHYNQGVTITGTRTDTPISYYPLSVNYNATYAPKDSVTELNAGLNFHVRGMGSSAEEFELNRHGADGSYIYLRGDLAHTHELPAGLQGFVKVEGQVSDQPLVNSEQYAGGGLGTVRGYLEAEQLGDNAIGGTVELRSPSLLGFIHHHRDENSDKSGDAGEAEKVEEKDTTNDWRVYVFADGAILTIRSPLPEQDSRFNLASYGVGSRIKLFDHFNGSIDAAVPLFNQTNTSAHDLTVTFRVWADF